MIVTHKEETKSTQRTSFDVMLFNRAHQSYKCRIDIYLGNCDGIMMWVTLKNTVLEIFHFRILKVMYINFT